EGAVVGQISVVDPDAGDSHSFTVSDDRFEVVEGALRLKPGVALDHEAAAEINLEVTATDSGGLSRTESFSIEVAPSIDISMSSGFQVQYFDIDHRLNELSDVDWSAPPTHQEIKTEINYENSRESFWEGGSRDTFGAKIEGTVEVEVGGTYKFYAGGDDGVMLYVNGAPIVDNDGRHGFRTRSGEVELEPGTHHIEVRYFENTGHAGLKLEWEGPGIDGKALVMPPETGSEATISGVPVSFELQYDATDLSPDATVVVDDLPPGTIVSAADKSITVDETGSADITGWEGDLLQITPPVDFVGTIDGGVLVTTPMSGGSSSQQTLPVSIDVDAATVAPVKAGLSGGFSASYFDVDHSLHRLDDIDWTSDPTHQERVSEINYENSRESFWEGGSRDTFGAKIEGTVEVEVGGTYKFYAGGDDGVMLYVNGAPIVDNDGKHGFRTRSGEVELEPGTHHIEVRYFENTGHAGLKLEWEGPDTEGRELLQAAPGTEIEQNGTFEVAIQLDNASDAATVEIAGLPPDVIVVSGDQSLISDGRVVDLAGWDVGQLEISPPSSFEGLIEGEIIVHDIAFNGAPITSTSSFELGVGDTDAEPADAIILGEQDYDTQRSNVETQNGFEGDDGSDLDDEHALSEKVVVREPDEISEMSLDSHERIDW
ncbi:MAG: PA14 domain-containing protein, partial [Pseudomonadota bacterium]